MRSFAFAVIFVLGAVVAAAESATDQDTSQRPAANTSPRSVIQPEKLAALLPQIAEWTRLEPDTDLVTTGITMSLARVTYEKGESSISLEIMDTATNQMLIAPITMLMKSGVPDTGKGYRKASSIGGFPGLESWDPEGPTADVIVIVGNRFLVKATAAGVPDTVAARKAVEAVDLKALSSLKQP